MKTEFLLRELRLPISGLEENTLVDADGFIPLIGIDPKAPNHRKRMLLQAYDTVHEVVERNSLIDLIVLEVRVSSTQGELRKLLTTTGAFLTSRASLNLALATIRHGTHGQLEVCIAIQRGAVWDEAVTRAWKNHMASSSYDTGLNAIEFKMADSTSVARAMCLSVDSFLERASFPNNNMHFAHKVELPKVHYQTIWAADIQEALKTASQLISSRKEKRRRLS